MYTKRGTYLVEDVHLHGKHKLSILYIGRLFCDPPKHSRPSTGNETAEDAEEIKEEVSGPITHIRFDTEDMDV